MKTMTKRDSDGMRCGKKTASGNSILKGRKCHTYASQVPYLAGLNTILTKAMLLVLLFLVGGMVNGAWAAKYNYCYYIVNLNGTVSTWAWSGNVDETSAPIVPEYVRSPLVGSDGKTNYHFWKRSDFTVTDESTIVYTPDWRGLTDGNTPEKWQTIQDVAPKANGRFTKTGTTEITSLSDLSTETQDDGKYRYVIYVTYDYDNSTSPIDLSGTSSHWMQTNGWYVYKTDTDGSAHGTVHSKCERNNEGTGTKKPSISNDAYQFYFKSPGSNPDPYNIRIYSRKLGGEKFACVYFDKTWSGRNNDGVGADESQCMPVWMTEAEINAIDSKHKITTWSLVKSFTAPAESDRFLLMTNYINLDENSPTNDKSYDGVRYNFWCSYSNQGKTGIVYNKKSQRQNPTDNDIRLTRLNTIYTYKVLDESGNLVAIAKGDNISPKIPDEIFSPFVTKYSYYNTESAAKAASYGADSNITDLSTDDDNVIWVRYTYDKELFDGTSHHLLINLLKNNKFLNYANYRFAGYNNSPSWTDWNESGNSEGEAQHAKLQTHRWWQVEGDPYQATLKNYARNQFGGNFYLNSSLSVYKNGNNYNSFSYSNLGFSDSPDCYKFMLLSFEETPSSTDSRFTIRLNLGLRTGVEADHERYYFMGNEGGGNMCIRNAHNWSSVNPAYVRYYYDDVKLGITVDGVNVTYHVLDANNGYSEIFTTTLREVPGLPAKLPKEAIRYHCNYQDGTNVRVGSKDGSILSTYNTTDTDLYAIYTGTDENFPFQFSTAEDEHWYAIEITKDKLLLRNPISGNNIKNGNTALTAAQATKEGVAAYLLSTGDPDQFLWSFWGGNPYNIKVKNRKTETFMAAESNNPERNKTWQSNKGNAYKNYLAPSATDANNVWGIRQGYRWQVPGEFGLSMLEAPHNFWRLDGNDMLLNYRQAWDMPGEYSSGIRSSAEGLRVFEYDIIEYEYVTVKICKPDGTVSAEVAYKPLDETHPSTFVKNGSFTLSDLENSLKRKFCSYELMPDDDFTKEPVASVAIPGNTTEESPKVIYIRYSSSMPFATSTDYGEAVWHTLLVNGQKYAFDNTTQISGGNDISYSKNAQFAFIGDPYALKIINRNAGDGKYMGVAAKSEANTYVTFSEWSEDDLYTWDLPLDDYADDEFCLRQKGTSMYSTFVGGAAPFKYSSSKCKTKATALPDRDYTYNIVDQTGRIAIKYTVRQTMNIRLNGYASIPEAIRSPYLKDEEIHFYTTFTENDLTTLDNEITEAPIGNANIYVRYTTDHRTDFALRLGGARSFDMRVNGQYVYDKNSAIMHQSTVDTDSDGDPKQVFLWYLTGKDPYAVQIENVNDKKYFTFNTGGESISLSGTPTTTFIITGITTSTRTVDDKEIEDIQVELMAATGEDAATKYYNIGRGNNDVDNVKLFNNTDAPQGDDKLKVVLNVAKLHISYCLVDLSHKVILEIPAGDEIEKNFPAEWRSPLATNFQYWIAENFKNPSSGIFELKDDQTEIASLAESVDGKVYVTYEATTDVDLDGRKKVEDNQEGKMYLLEFKNGVSFVQENGKDGFNPSATKAVYPYNNGEANLYIYGEEQWNEQQLGAASTRTRWAWYVEGGDPYRARFSSFQAQASSNAYLRTYLPDGYGEVVTGVITKNSNVPAEQAPTEYMILGSASNYKLVTTGLVNGSHVTVNSFEQYWKNNPTALNILLEAKGLEEKSDAAKAYAAELNTRDLNTTEKAALSAKGWHTYKAWANINSWTSTTGKTYQYTDHWFQSISMDNDGNDEPVFDFIPIDLDGVLVLIDNHGWEIMRKPMARKGADNTTERNNAIRAYDSPMVERYYFNYNYSKVPGYHKYKPTTTASKASDNVQTVGTGTSLTDYVNYYSALNNNGTLRDVYVTYDVKAQYADAFTNGQTFVIRQDSKLASTTDGTTITPEDVPAGLDNGDPSVITDEKLHWYLKPNADIDDEMGIEYGQTVTEEDGTVTVITKDREGMQADYDAAGQNGFDPYNLRIESKTQHGKYFTTNASDASLSGGVWTSATGSSVSLTDATATYNAVGHDATTCKVSNATFLAVQDENGNLRLMPRFDHSKVIEGFTALASQAVAQPIDDKAHSQTTRLYQPNAFTYIVVDNQGHEALHYTTVSSGAPDIPYKFMSPLATGFRFYQGLTKTGDTYNLSDIESHRITGSFSAAGMTSGNVYVRYSYDSECDVDGLLKGRWFTMKIGSTQMEKNGSGITTGSTNGTWRFIHSASDKPDPYAVKLYNKVDMTTPATNDTYIIFHHSSNDGTANDGYALMQAGNNSTTDYSFLGNNASAATVTIQTDYTKEGEMEANRKITLVQTLGPTSVTYKVITHTGKTALTSTPVEYNEAQMTDENFTFSLPHWMRTPLMKDADDTYIYYSAITGSAADEFTEGYKATPYNLDADGVVYVRYDYAKSRQATTLNKDYSTEKLDLTGNVPVVFFFSGHMSYYHEGDQAELVRTASSVRGNRTNLIWYFTGNDPYEIKISSPAFGEGKYLSTKAESYYTESQEPNDDTYLARVKSEGDAEFPNNTFMILSKGDSKGSKKSLLLYVSGSQRLLLRQRDFSPKTQWIMVYKDNYDYSTRCDGTAPATIKGKNTINGYYPTCGDQGSDGDFTFYPSMVYHIITNRGAEALTYVTRHNYTTMSVPERLQSPLLNLTDYVYYSERPVLNSEGTELLVNEESEQESGTLLSKLFDNYIGHIYVRYSYDKETSPVYIHNDTYLPVPSDGDYSDTWYTNTYIKTRDTGSEEYAMVNGLDLSGQTWYNMTDVIQPSGHRGSFVYYNGSSYTTTGSASGIQNSVRPALSSKGMLWRFEGDDPYAIRIYNSAAGSGSYVQNKEFALVKFYTNDYGKYGEVLSNVSGAWWFVFMETGDEKHILQNNMTIRDLGNDGNWYAYSTPYFNVNNNTFCAGFYKAPVARKYRYHAIRYNGTSKVGETWTATMEHDWLMPLVLEDNIARLYCKYEKNTVEEADDVTGSNTFDTRAALEALDNAQFYSDAALTQRVFDEDATTHKKTYDVYPAIDTETICDIYFKYQVDTETAIGGLTLGDITSTAAEVAADVAYRKEKGQIDEEHLKNDVHANWYYMVLDTDYDLTATGTGAGRTFTGKQRFLRREDNGTVGWMDNAYALHYQNTDNLNNWSYNRLAESYRQGENDAFREGRWLWTFMGDDPYNLRVLNLETAVGVTATGKGVYTMPAADDCWTTITKRVTETRDNKGNVTGTTTSYPVTVPTERPAEGPAVSYTWGIMQGSLFGSGEQTFNLVSTAMTEERDGVTMNLPLCWQMVTNETTKADSVAAMTRTNDRQNAIRLLKYEPMKYQDVNLVVKRDDHVAEYKTWKAANEDATADAKRIKLKSYDSGISLLYYTASERAYAAGDLIDMSRADALPLNVRRAFCTYKVYSDDFENEGGIYTVKDGPYPYKAQQATITGKWTETSTGVWEYVPGSGDLIVDEDGRAVYPYINEDGTPALGGAQSLYAQYTVTSDVFLKTAPTKTEVAAMAENNDHVYFMDFPDTNKDGSDNTHHAFFDTDAKFRIQTGDLSKKVDKKSGTWRTEKRVWDGAKFVDDTATPYNYCQFRTTDNRMISVPEHLKWYFVGDPYRVQVFNAYENAAWNETEITDTKGTKWLAGTKAANLARFSTVETNFQFVVDCVHLQVPDYTNIDNRPELYPTDEMGNRLDPIPNRNEGKPYYNDFYWECVPTVSDDPNAFALRFKEDNDLLGYRNVYYYLAHEGLTKQYRQDGDNVTYHINLNYKADNEQYTSGDYIGYHKANDQNTVIRLVQPVKLYVSANRQSDSRYDAKSNVTTDELSEYYGLGETVEEVPRHLQRKFVSYDWTNLELTDANKYSSTACTDHASDVFVSPNDVNYVFKRTVNYTVKDLTSDGVHLFSSCSDPANPLSTELQWLDVMIGNNNWLYYDKTNVGSDGKENLTTLVSNYARALSADKKGWYGTANGWTDGLKGLHWAFIGDPYDFTVVNRRRFEDGGGTGDQWLQSSDNLVMTATAGSATHYATKMWKTGGDSEYILTTQDIAKRMVAQKSATEFRLMDHQLTDRRIYTANENDLNYENYVVNGYCYNPTLAGLGGMQQKLQIRTAVAKDEDNADNDCFDTGVRIYSATGIRRIEIDDMEIKYGKAGDVLPISLRRYGCTYDCYLVTDGDSVKIDDFDAATTLTSTDANINGKTFREFVATGTKFHLSYVYNVENDAAQFFTSTSDAMTEDYTWMNTYFSWDQYYSGTNVEVEYYEREFDHYVYNAQGAIIDEVYNMIRRTKVDPNPQQAYPTTAYLNSHTGQSNIYADEGTQSEKDRQKWSLVGDPYEFTMKNYAQYLVNGSSVLTMDGKNVSSTNNAAQSQNFAIAVDKSGNTYLAIVGDNGQILQCITFEFSTTSDKELFSKGTGTNQHDPTGNTLDTKDVKPFKLANLIRYADILQYHLVIAHQHSLDHTDELSDDNAKILKDHLLEYLKYQGIRKNEPGMYVNSDVSDYLAEKKDEITTLLKKNASLRDFISYPIEDYSVSRVGIGNHPQVPWYMKRQFCRYYLYQRDVERSVTLDGSFDYDGDGVVGDEDDIKLAYKKDENGNYLDEDGNITTDPEKRVQLWIDKANNKPAYEITWESIDNKTFWDAWNADEDGDPVTGPNKDRAYKKSDGSWLKKPKYYDEAMALNGKVLDKLQDCHFNRKVKIDVVYEVIPEEFQFATRGRNTTAWYQMMTNNDADGLMNFTYKNGIGARLDRIEHYTNNYLWAPEGDPYGFVLRSRYATINGTGWDNVAVTTKGRLPKRDDNTAETDYTTDELNDGTGKISKFQANYTNEAQFDDKRIIHKLKGEGEDDATSDGPSNAVYEMFTGNAAYTNSFLMHPTSAYINTADTDFKSYYMTHDTKTNISKLVLTSGRALQTNADANWSLHATAEQLLPYFERAGYVGGLDPKKATDDFSYHDYYEQLKAAKKSGTRLDFATLRKIQDIVYEGTFYQNDGTTEVKEGSKRPDQQYLPMKFKAANLVNMAPGYYRIKAFSEDALNYDGEDMSDTKIKGIIGPRYISGYRFESEKVDNPSYLSQGGRWLHFNETDMKHATIHTYADLKAKITAVNAAVASSGKSDDEKALLKDRDVFDHTAMHGNIEILPADFDPSSIFYFTEANATYGQYSLATQGLQLRARPGGTQAEAGVIDDACGHTEMVDATSELKTGYSKVFRLDDIGGAAVTLRTFDAAPSGTAWDTEVKTTLTTNYVCIDGHHRYRITCHKGNEMVEVGDHYTTDGLHGIQDTKWLLQPVGIREQWPYNEMPLRVEVQKGGVDKSGNEDNHYYGSLYVPFDTRLGNPADAAFTLTTPTITDATTSVTMSSVSQLNEMGNPQFVPANWPVVVRTTNDKNRVELKNQDGSTYATRHYVNMYIPNAEPTKILNTIDGTAAIKLKGQLLEKTLTTDDLDEAELANKTIMVFGLPFEGGTSHSSHEYDAGKQVGFYTNDNWARSTRNDGWPTAAYSDYKAHEGSYPTAGTVATHAQRSNKYVYHNKVYYVLDKAYEAPSPSRHIVAIFDGDTDDEEQRPIDITDKADTPWPCDVYDTAGRRVAENETPSTLLKNHPALRRGVYIFGGRKVVIK